VNQQVAYWTNQVNSLDRVINSGGQQPLNPSADPVIKSLTKQENTESGLEQRYYQQWQCQLYGGCGSPKGNGSLAKASLDSYLRAKQAVTDLQTQITDRLNVLSATDKKSQATRLQQAQSALPNAKAQLANAQAQETALRNNFENNNLATNGLLIRLQALNELSAGDFTLNSTRLLLFLFFLVIECLPITVKLLQRPGIYEEILQTTAERDLSDAKRAIRSRQVPVTAALAQAPGSAGSAAASTGGPRAAHGTSESDLAREAWRTGPEVPTPNRPENEARVLWQANATMPSQGGAVHDDGRTPPSPLGGLPGSSARTGPDSNPRAPSVIDPYAIDSPGGGIPPGAPDPGGGAPHARRRYLKSRCPEGVRVGKPFSLLASVVLAAGPHSTQLEAFDVPPEGRDVLLVIYAPGLQLLSDQQQIVHVPADSDSMPARFELRADTPGPLAVSITAWIGGTYLGELVIEITAERDRMPGPHREVLAAITTEVTEGAVSLVVRYDKIQNAYRFEFRDEDYPAEVTCSLAYDPGPVVEHLIADLDNLAKGRSGYSAAQTRDYLVNAGARLWRQLLPEQLREQFWDRQHRIRQLTILADKDAVPWELLYPMDSGRAAGFLVEQFPVTRAIFGWRPARTLRLRPARFVLPEGSLREASDEIDTMRQLLDPGQPPSDVISALTPLTELISSGSFGLLHFACHNTYDPVGGSSIRLGNVQFTPTLLEVAAIQKALEHSAPTIFINACRSAGLNATYNQLDGWASKFLEAGAAAFIGSLWAVSDGAAREFAQELYTQLRAGSALGEAVMRARHVAASQPDDPTWLAYAVYGNPRATVSQRP
jgi:hypothetical protein